MLYFRNLFVLILLCLTGASGGCRRESVTPPRGASSAERLQSAPLPRGAALLHRVVVPEASTPAIVKPAPVAVPGPELSPIPERDLCVARVWLDLAQSKVGDPLDHRRELYLQLARFLTPAKEIR